MVLCKYLGRQIVRIPMHHVIIPRTSDVGHENVVSQLAKLEVEVEVEVLQRAWLIGRKVARPMLLLPILNTYTYT